MAVPMPEKFVCKLATSHFCFSIFFVFLGNDLKTLNCNRNLSVCFDCIAFRYNLVFLFIKISKKISV